MYIMADGAEKDKSLDLEGNKNVQNSNVESHTCMMDNDFLLLLLICHLSFSVLKFWWSREAELWGSIPAITKWWGDVTTSYPTYVVFVS